MSNDAVDCVMVLDRACQHAHTRRQKAIEVRRDTAEYRRLILRDVDDCGMKGSVSAT
jgi:hypothetical protein